MTRTLLIPITVFAAACMAPDATSQIQVSEANDLGVSALEIARSEAGGFQVFELQGLRDGEQVASIRLRLGDAAALDRHLADADGIGAELVGQAEGHQQQTFMAKQSVYQVEFADPTIQKFAQLPTVSAVLSRESNIAILTPIAPPREQAYAAWGCSSGEVNTSPPANQCCEYNAEGPGGYASTPAYNFFVAGATGKSAHQYDLIGRTRQASGLGCRDTSNNACTGTTCYFGPNGFHINGVSTPPSGQYYQTYQETVDTYDPSSDSDWYFNVCQLALQGDPNPYSDYPNVTGTFAIGMGCCAGTATTSPNCCNGSPQSSSTCSQWCYDDDDGWYDCSYPATATGAPGGNSGYGAYDY